jgi:hypothetical protein
MAMNFAPLDCSCQGASSEPKKIYLDFSVLEKFAKNQKITYFWLPHQKMGSTGGTFTIPDFNLSYTITHRNFVRIADKNFFRKNMIGHVFFDNPTRKFLTNRIAAFFKFGPIKLIYSKKTSSRVKKQPAE